MSHHSAQAVVETHTTKAKKRNIRTLICPTILVALTLCSGLAVSYENYPGQKHYCTTANLQSCGSRALGVTTVQVLLTLVASYLVLNVIMQARKCIAFAKTNHDMIKPTRPDPRNPHALEICIEQMSDFSRWSAWNRWNDMRADLASISIDLICAVAYFIILTVF